MILADLLRETLYMDSPGVWENEPTLTSVRLFGVGLHSIGIFEGVIKYASCALSGDFTTLFAYEPVTLVRHRFY